MTTAADVVFVDGEVHTLTEPDRTAEAVAVRDGRVVRVADTYEVEFLEGVGTRRIDLGGRVLLPGFVDAHVHMQQLGQYQVHADLGAASDLEDALDRFRDAARPEREWILGFGFDESEWSEGRFPTMADLDAVSDERPVAAIRVDMHSAVLNSVAYDRLEAAMPATHVETAAGDPTGTVVEDATEALWTAIEPDHAETRQLIEAAIAYAHEQGVTAVHDMVRQSHAPAVYQEMAVAGDLPLRVRVNYWRDHLEALEGLGLRSGFGNEFLQVGGVKTFTDGSLGSRTAKLSTPYADAPDEDGTWVVDPEALAAVATAATENGLQVVAHAIGDVAIDETLAVLADRPGERHRIEHAELATDDDIEQFAETGAIASLQPNFLKWAHEDGLYDRRLGEERRKGSNRFARFLEADVPVAFGSDCMPMDPLFGIHETVNAPVEAQRLDVTDAFRAYTHGGAYAAFDEDRMGTVETGKLADFVVLEDSPWENPNAIADIDVAMTVVDGEVVYDAGTS